MVDVSKYRCMYIENSCVGKKSAVYMWCQNTLEL